MSTPPNRGAASPRPVEIHRVKDGEACIVKFLGGYAGCDLHYKHGVKKQYFPCLGTDCDPLIHRLRPEWRAWAPVLMWEDLTALWWPTVLEITPTIEEGLKGRQLRGETWSILRPQKKAQGNPAVVVLVESSKPDGLPKAFDIEPILLRAYKVSRIVLGKANPVPPRVILSGYEAALPEGLKLPEAPERTPPTAEQLAKIRELAGRTAAASKLNGQAHKREGSGNG